MNSTTIRISAKPSQEPVSIALPSSKSIANRALIINALADGNGNLSRLSEARDTQTMLRLLQTGTSEWDVLDAGTTMRFLTAFGAVTNQHKILTGTKRMKERPIGILVNALKSLGAEIDFLENDGYPPLALKGFSKQKTASLEIQGDVSSQYISALMMIAPCLPEGLTLHLTGRIGSRPYINMTRAVMAVFGVDARWISDSSIFIPHQRYVSADYEIEPDWSAASYWYSIAAISGSPVFLERLIDNSIQGDRKIADLMVNLGVESSFTAEGTRLIKTGKTGDFTADFTDCPDIAQTVAVTAACLGVTVEMFGLQSLRIKETDRIAALQQELAKIGCRLTEPEENHRWVLEPGKLTRPDTAFETYHDHRMAMAFAPIAWKYPIEMTDPAVVNKSYPSFWSDLGLAGASVQNF